MADKRPGQREAMTGHARKDAPGELPRMLSIAKVGEIFGRAPRTIRDWIERGHLSPVKVGNSVFIPWAQIDALLSNPRPSKSPSRKANIKGGKSTA
jgi:hypothetical protein